MIIKVYYNLTILKV